MQFPPDNASNKLRRDVAAHEAETEIASAYDLLTSAEEKTHIYSELKRMHSMIVELKKHMEFAFPDADLGKHHAEHLGLREDRKFWRDFRVNTWTAVFGVLIVLIFVFAFTGRR